MTVYEGISSMLFKGVMSKQGKQYRVKSVYDVYILNKFH